MRYVGLLIACLLLAGGCVSNKVTEETGRANEVEARHMEPGGEGGPADGGVAGRTMPDAEGPEVNAGAEDSSRGSGEAQPALSEAEVVEHTDSIMGVIESLERCYETGDFQKWKSLLTPLYLEKHNDPRYLQSQGWQAKDLFSFFRLLIRMRTKGNVTALPVSRLEFINPDKALVFVFLGGKEFPQPQHTFIRSGNRWRKGLQEEGD